METRFKVLSWIDKLSFRTENLLDPTILEPTATTPLYQGEWLVIDATTGKLKRLAAGGMTDPDVCYPFIDQEYQYDTRGLGAVSVLKANVFEFKTSVYDASNAPSGIGAKCYVGLVGGRMVIDDSNAGGNLVIARLTKAAAVDGFIQAIRIWT
jgi:hypothetical protein